MDFYNQLIAAFTFDNIPFLIVSAITFGFGYWEYIYSFRITFRENKSPFPIWMHTFYFSHDSTWAIILLIAASKHNWNWFLTLASIALFVWTCFEIFNLYHSIKYERQETWGNYYKGETVTQRQALTRILLQIACFYAVMFTLIQFMGAGCFMQTSAMTNILMAVGPGILAKQRGSREGSSVGLSIVILFGTINTFLPNSMFAAALPDTFQHPAYYITGMIVSLIAAKNVYMMFKFPSKKAISGQKKPIW